MWELKPPFRAAFWISLIMTFRREYVQAFLSDRVSYQDIPENDYTLRVLTKETLVRVVAKYFEESNPERYNPGDLLELDPLTASVLFEEHFGGKYLHL